MGPRLFEKAVVSPFPTGRAYTVPVSLAAHAVVVGAILLTQALRPTELPPPTTLSILPFPRLNDAPAPPPQKRGDAGTRMMRSATQRPQVASVAPLPVLDFPDADPTKGSEDLLATTIPDGGCSGCSPDGDPDGVEGGFIGGGGNGPAPPASEPLRVGGDVRAPQKLRHVNPVYPEIAKAARVQGEVVLECVIDADGRVAGVRVLRGVRLLDDAAVAAVSQWVYRPTLLNGQPVPVIMNVTVHFRIR
jgi:protein TonB